MMTTRRTWKFYAINDGQNRHDMNLEIRKKSIKINGTKRLQQNHIKRKLFIAELSNLSEAHADSYEYNMEWYMKRKDLDIF